LYPLALLEVPSPDYITQQEQLQDLLIYGTYPQVYTVETSAEKKTELESIRDGYLLRDILELDNLKDSLFIFNLLRQLAFQIGQDVSPAELASNLQVNRKTVVRYLDLLEKCYVIYAHYGFSRNLRKEISKNPRYYFRDNGMRNSIINNYNALSSRDDVGRLWENFCVSERTKYLEYNQISANKYFWRTYDRKEIDLIEEREGTLFAFECKFSKGQAVAPKDFRTAYPQASFQVINRDNYLEHIT
jgi:predicted AAA+ superfamily ATPase